MFTFPAAAGDTVEAGGACAGPELPATAGPVGAWVGVADEGEAAAWGWLAVWVSFGNRSQ